MKQGSIQTLRGSVLCCSAWKRWVECTDKDQWILAIFFLRVFFLAPMPHKVQLLKLPVALLLACFQILTCPKPFEASVWLCFNYYFSHGALLETYSVFNVIIFSGNIDCFMIPWPLAVAQNTQVCLALAAAKLMDTNFAGGGHGCRWIGPESVGSKELAMFLVACCSGWASRGSAGELALVMMMMLAGWPI